MILIIFVYQSYTHNTFSKKWCDFPFNNRVFFDYIGGNFPFSFSVNSLSTICDACDRSEMKIWQNSYHFITFGRSCVYQGVYILLYFVRDSFYKKSSWKTVDTQKVLCWEPVIYFTVSQKFIFNFMLCRYNYWFFMLYENFLGKLFSLYEKLCLNWSVFVEEK